MALLDRFRPKWKHSDADMRREAITEVTDPGVLTAIIIGDGDWFVRHEAFSALRNMQPDQSHYCRLTRESLDEEIRRKAVKVMTDEPELARVAREDKYLYIRDAADHRLNELRSGVWDGLS